MQTTITAPRIKWQYSGIVDTVRVIFAINRNGSPNEASLENYIMSLSANYAANCVAKGEHPTMTGTGGWYVTFVPSEDEDYDYNVEVTIMSYVVARYLEHTKVI